MSKPIAEDFEALAQAMREIQRAEGRLPPTAPTPAPRAKQAWRKTSNDVCCCSVCKDRGWVVLTANMLVECPVCLNPHNKKKPGT